MNINKYGWVNWHGMGLTDEQASDGLRTITMSQKKNRVKVASLSANNLTVVPYELFQLAEISSLEVLWLVHNFISSFPLTPSSIGMTSLKKLWLSDNRLLTLPGCMTMLTRLESYIKT